MGSKMVKNMLTKYKYGPLSAKQIRLPNIWSVDFLLKSLNSKNLKIADVIITIELPPNETSKSGQEKNISVDYRLTLKILNLHRLFVHLRSGVHQKLAL